MKVIERNRFSPINNGGTQEDHMRLLEMKRAEKGQRLIEKWSRMIGIGEGLNDMQSVSPRKAENTAIILENQEKHLKAIGEANVSSLYRMLPHQVMKIVRLGYPNAIRGDIFWDWPMSTPHEAVYYLSPHYESSKRGATEGAITHESHSYRYATEIQQITRTLVSGDISTKQITIPSSVLSSTDTPIRPGTVRVYFQDGGSTANRTPVAVDESGGNLMPVQSRISTTATASVNYNPGATDNFVVFTLGTDSPTPVAGDIVTVEFNYDSEESDNYGELGSVRLELTDYLFRARPYPLQISWSILSEILLQGTLQIDAMDSLVNAMSQEIRKSLDYMAVTEAVRYASANTVTTFDHNGATGESEIDRAMALSRAISDTENAMYEDTNRGGMSSMICGIQAESFLKLHGRFMAESNPSKVGIFKCGMLDGMAVYKAPPDVVPKGSIIFVYKNEMVMGDVSIAFGTYIPMYMTQTLEYSSRHKEMGAAHYGDFKVFQPQYMRRLNISNL